jgi:hypothetical protein
LLSVGQGLQQAALLRIDLLEPGIELRQAPQRTASLGGTPRLLQFQASHL